ncbi:hypothetical protein [Vibrio phage vB_VmeM-Yong XC32]|nr:hypothetical protein [Vibrio phage vB_VmeM-Yong XC31]QAX96560.1 hypothetical protein [Vibrio phage vB_VmeM-Yong XC32]QAX96878.1 hypothetical protein [Vibrio phage vB_VmeM-Yong MS31]QAX97183.1 hypothetical protein [Vibrio phage vB_VmeM-Yong MS32]
MELVALEHIDKETWNAMRLRLIDAVDEAPKGWKKDGFRNSLACLTTAFENRDYLEVRPIHTRDSLFRTSGDTVDGGYLTWYVEDDLLGLLVATEATQSSLYAHHGINLEYPFVSADAVTHLIASSEEDYIEFLSGGTDYIRIATDFLHVPTKSHVMTFTTSNWDIREADIGLTTPPYSKVPHFEKLRMLEQDRKKSVAVLHRCIEENVRLVKHMGHPAVIESINLIGLTKDDMSFKVRSCDEVFSCSFLEWLD